MTKTKLVKFNINNYVQIRLTEAGRDILYKQHLQLQKYIQQKNLNYATVPFKINEDSQGWSRWQFHTLISKFGAAISLSQQPPFELEIKLEIHT